MQNAPIHLSGLNGLRAIAALSVVVAHVTLDHIADFGFPNNFDFAMADYGVTLFFVISGFLITFLLLKEIENTSTISVPKFYARRILRIWPIYYLFIIISFIVCWIFNSEIQFYNQNFWLYIFFASNIPLVFHQQIFILAHYWSIGVEEQFYALWPWLVKFSKNKLLLISLSVFGVIFLLKLFWSFESYSLSLILISK